MTESEFVRHMPCENCGSSDANSLYSDGHTYCFVCHNRTGDNDVIHSQRMTQNVYLETKGYWSPSDRRKILNVKKSNPEVDLRMVFQAPFNKINKNSKTTYAKWCEKHDIPWTHFHDIPIDWLV